MDGIPPGCHDRRCPLDHENIVFNKNSYAKLIGFVGYPFFDEHRKVFFGFVSAFTVVAFFVTMWGCFALSLDRPIIQRTYWTGASGKNTTSGKSFALYVGLRSVEFVDCAFTAGYNKYADYCDRNTVEWSSDRCHVGLIGEACDACGKIATTMWFTAFMSCASLVLSFLGAQTRMITKGDVPVQKLMGMGSELWGALSLGMSLYVFHNTCWAKLHTVLNHDDIEARTWSGPGYICYLVCCFSALLRAVVHWLTPLPGKGLGLCCCLVPSEERTCQIIRVKPTSEYKNDSKPKNSAV